MRYWGASECWSCVRPLRRTEVAKFEEEFGAYLGVAHVTATRYARTALYLALRALDVRSQEVLLPAFTCNTVRDAVCLAGATPVFVDIDPGDLSMDMAQLRQKTNHRTKALVITHYYGKLAGNFDALLSFAKDSHLIAIEDCAHCLGLTYKGQKVGTFGDMAAFSLGKNILDFGGGIVVCTNETYHERIRHLVSVESKRSGWTEFGLMYPIFNRGFGPVMDRVIFNRVGNRASKTLMAWLLKTGHRILTIIPRRRPTATTTNGSTAYGWTQVARQQVGRIEDDKVRVQLAMPRIVAALGRAQLRKLDYFNRKRTDICAILAPDIGCSCPQGVGNEGRGSTNTFFPMRFEGADIERIREHCEKRGLSLLATWPAHQEYWPEQDTDNVRRVGDSLLLWWVHPMTTRSEIAEMKKILGPFELLNSAGSPPHLLETKPLIRDSDITKQ